MTNKEAIKRLEWVKKRICDITYSPESFEAINLAIKALEERPQGEWEKPFLHNDGIYYHKCNVCHICSELSILQEKYCNFCPNCGARMGADHETG